MALKILFNGTSQYPFIGSNTKEKFKTDSLQQLQIFFFLLLFLTTKKYKTKKKE